MDSILIIDDDLFLCKALAEELTFHGFDVHYAADGDKAEATLNSKKFAIILLDLMMPVKDGFYFLRYFKDHDIHSKVFVLTAYANIDTALEAARLGATEFFNKPYELDDLISAIKKALQ